VPTLQCDADKFWDSAKADNAVGATDAETKASCCTAKASCSTLTTCPAGWKKKSESDASALYCASSTCTLQTDGGKCCDSDDTKCAGLPSLFQCDAGQFKDGAKNGEDAGTTDAQKKANCCTAKGSCSTYTCPAGHKKKDDASTTTCDYANAQCTMMEGNQKCCEADTTKCGGISAIECDGDNYWDSAKADVEFGTSDADKKTNCCTPKATCAVYEEVVETQTSRASKSETVAKLLLCMFAIAAVSS